MRRDDQIKVAISVKKDFIMGTGWQIVCEDEALRDTLTQNLQTLDSPFEHVLRDFLTAFEYGFSLAEPIYELKDGLYRWKSIRVRPPHSFRFNIDSYGNIVTITQATDSGEIQIEPDRLLHYIYQPYFNNPYGESDLRSAHQPWVTKKFVNRFLAVYLERFASPTAVAKYKANFSDVEIARLQDLLKSMQSTTQIVMPEDAIIDFLQPSRDSSDTFIKAINLCNTMIARAILVPDLLGISGEKTSGGSYSLGETQFNIFQASIQKEREVLQRLINLRLIEPLLKTNWGDKAKAHFEFLPLTKDDESKYADIWIRAAAGKIWKPTDEEVNHLRATLKFPQGDVELINPAPAENPFQRPPLPAKNEPEAKEEKDDEDEKEEKDLSHFHGVKMYREVTPYEKKVNFSQIKTTLQNAEDKILPKLAAAGNDIWKDYLQQIVDRNVVGRWKPEVLNSIQPKFQKPMNVLFKKHFLSLFKSAYAEAREELLPDAPKNFAAMDDESIDLVWPEDVMKLIEADAFRVVGDYTADMTKRVRNAIMNGIRTGKSTRDMVAQLKDEMPDFSENRLNTIVRTKTTEVYNQARKSYWETDPYAKQIVSAYQFSAILDSRTSEVCEALDGKIYDRGEYTDSVTPPLHFNCRSVLVPITKFEDYTTDKEIPAGKLQDMGASFMAEDATVSPISSVEAGRPDLVTTLDIMAVGDSVVLAAAPAGRRIEVVTLHVGNLSRQDPVIIGFRDSADADVKFRSTLDKMGVWSKDFDEPWLLAEGLSLSINCSANVPVNVTVRFRVMDLEGNRVA